MDNNQLTIHIPSNYEIIDSYSGVDDYGWRSGNSHNYGKSPLLFVKARGKYYGILANSNEANNNEKEVIPCKYDAIYSNDGCQIKDLDGNFFKNEEQA